MLRCVLLVVLVGLAAGAVRLERAATATAAGAQIVAGRP